MLSRKKKNQMRKAFKINLINLFPPVCYVSVISPPLWKKEMLNWKAVLTWGWTAALFLPLEDKNTHCQGESRRVRLICQISFHPMCLDVTKNSFNTQPSEQVRQVSHLSAHWRWRNEIRLRGVGSNHRSSQPSSRPWSATPSSPWEAADTRKHFDIMS